MDPRMFPDDALQYAKSRLDAYRQEAGWEMVLRASRRRPRTTFRAAIGHVLVGMGYAVAGEARR